MTDFYHIFGLAERSCPQLLSETALFCGIKVSQSSDLKVLNRVPKSGKEFCVQKLGEGGEE
jgi:hypothetical protein